MTRPPASPQDQRRHQRFDVKLNAEIQREDGVFTATTKNLSVGGAALEPERPLHEGETIRLSLFLVVDGIEDERTPPLVTMASVQWAAEGDHGDHMAGVQFQGLTDAQKAWLGQVLSRTGQGLE